MKPIILKSILLVSLLVVAEGVWAKKPSVRNYEVEPVAVGSVDTYLVKVWLYTKEKKWDKLSALAKNNAVHCIIFRGFEAKNGVERVPALAWENPNLEATHKDFFDSFFADDGKVLEFADVVSDGIAAENRVKLSSGGYKIGIEVSVRKRALKDYLVAAGILRSMDSGF
ncbi:hypothetical protein FACS189413_06770 [Bacteroidia bacterium]|nr:hypothetical protein FACS189413_06770 [Bacteroidia bacterium]